MTKPILMIVDDQPEYLATVRRELRQRYEAAYEVLALSSSQEALQQLTQFAVEGQPVALILAAWQLAPTSGTSFLASAYGTVPGAKRLLLMPPAHRSTTKPILRAVTLGQIDRFVQYPTLTVDEQFHHVITELLLEWQRAQAPPFKLVTLIGQRSDPYAYALRDLLQRSSLPFAFHDVDSSEGQRLLQAGSVPNGPFPVLILFNGQVLTKPTMEEVAVAFGVRHSREEGVFDLAIIGAGPAGLSAAVYGASEGLRTIIVDQETFGGQAGTTSLIRNYLGFPFGISGAELLSRALDQAWSFGVETSVLRQATAVRIDGDQRIVSFADGSEIRSRALLLAMGAAYQRIGIHNVEKLIGSGVFYGGGVTEARAMEGKHVFVVGAGNSAGQAAVHLAKYAQTVTMLVRSSSLSSTMSDYLIREIETVENIEILFRRVIVDASGTDRLESLTVEELGSGMRTIIPTAAVFILIGAVPRTEWLPPTIRRDAKGFILTGSDLISGFGAGGEAQPHLPMLMETSVPGVFAAGDVRHNSVKRVAAAVGEGGIAIQSVHRYLARIKEV